MVRPARGELLSAGSTRRMGEVVRSARRRERTEGELHEVRGVMDVGREVVVVVVVVKRD